MSTPAQIKSCLKLLETPPIAQVIHECIREVLQDINSGEDEGVGDQALARYSTRIIGRVKTSLRLKLQKEELAPKQRDLEEVINEIRLEEQAKQKEHGK